MKRTVRLPWRRWGWSDVENEFDGIKREKLTEKLEIRELEACVEKWDLFL